MYRCDSKWPIEWRSDAGAENSEVVDVQSASDRQEFGGPRSWCAGNGATEAPVSKAWP
jgi:hypothetical protein